MKPYILVSSNGRQYVRATHRRERVLQVIDRPTKARCGYDLVLQVGWYRITRSKDNRMRVKIGIRKPMRRFLRDAFRQALVIIDGKRIPKVVVRQLMIDGMDYYGVDIPIAADAEEPPHEA